MIMKFAFFTALIPVMLAACNNSSNDSVEKADSTNKARMDNSSDTTAKTSSADNKSDDKATADFLVKAMDGGIMEVDLGNIVKTKARNERVKKFGEMMIKDHTEANGKLKELAASRHVEVPSRVSNDKADMIGKLNKKDRKDFDKAYIDMMVDDHQEDIKEFEEAGNKTNDTQVKQFINRTLPVLRKHLDSCTAIRDALKSK